MISYNEFIKTFPIPARAKHSALLVDAALVFSQCIENPHANRNFDPYHFQILDICDLGPSLEEFRDEDLNALDAMFAEDLKFLGAEFIERDGDEYWRFDVSDPYKHYWLKQVLADIMQQTLYPH